MVTAKGVGSTLIIAMATCCQLADTVAVQVTQLPASVEVSPTSRTLAEGQSYQFVGVVKDAMGYVIPGREVTWSSDNTSVATVNGTGNVTGQSAGTTQIRGVSAELEDEATVSVTEPSAPPPPSDREPLFPLEIINIKPAGTGSPAIPSSNRIFRAYPGIEYNIRAAVIGGVYPYTYALSNAPAGMTINSRTGEISWPSPQASATDIQLSVKDSRHITISTTWSITVTSATSDFVFLDANSTAETENGAFATPYKSMATFFAGERGNGSKIAYWRGGNYAIPSNDRHLLGSYPRTWLAYPQETPVVDWIRHDPPGGPSYYGGNTQPYWDGITITNMMSAGLNIFTPAHYATIRRCVWDDITTNTSTNNNQGMLKFMGTGDHGFYAVVQDNEFKNFTGANAIGSLYNLDKLLIENNYIHSGGYYYLNQWRGGVSVKSQIHNLTVRGNKIVMDEYIPIGWYVPDGPRYHEVSYNLFVAPTTSGFSVQFSYPRDVLTYRNTIVGRVDHARGCWHERNGDNGPFEHRHNVLASSITSNPFQENLACVTATNNLTGTVVANLVDASNEYKLVSGQSEYVGSRGWQLVDGLTPLELGFPWRAAW